MHVDGMLVRTAASPVFFFTAVLDAGHPARTKRRRVAVNLYSVWTIAAAGRGVCEKQVVPPPTDVVTVRLVEEHTQSYPKCVDPHRISPSLTLPR